MIKLMVGEPTLTLMGLNTLDNGRMTNRMGLESKNGLMVKNMRDSIKMVQRLAKVYLNFWTEATIKANFLITKFTAKVRSCLFRCLCLVQK
jgi:hypothetical protein